MGWDKRRMSVGRHRSTYTWRGQQATRAVSKLTTNNNDYVDSPVFELPRAAGGEGNSTEGAARRRGRNYICT